MKLRLLLLAVAVALVTAACGDDTAGPRSAAVVSPSPSTSEPSLVVPTGGTDEPPPPIVARGSGEQQNALQASYCWGNACVDMVSPPWDDLPVLGAAPTVQAGFATTGEWTVTVTDRDRGCASYPVLLTPTGNNTYLLTPSGTAGERRLDVFIYPEPGGDTSGGFRWTTPGAAAPAAWAHLHQNSPNQGGMGVVQVVLDGAAVDGDVSGSVTVTGADRSETFDLATYHQGCSGDHYVTLAPQGHVDHRVDGLGAGPFTYNVDVIVDGTHHRATATSEDGAEDTPLAFAPALPAHEG